MMSATAIGIAASIFTGVSLLPQLIKLLNEKRSSDISMWMLASLFAGLALWIWYGIRQNDWVIISANSLSLFLNACIVLLNFYYRAKEN
jgi:MtN3 and saliva related transmembrane protein